MHSASPNQYVVVDDSTGDDESDGEDEEVARPLPTKAAARIGGGRAPLRGKQDDSDEENPEVEELQLKVEELEARINEILTANPLSNSSMQTDPALSGGFGGGGNGAGGSAEEVREARLESRKLQFKEDHSHVLGIGILDSGGWAGAVPNDMYVTVEITAPIAEGGVVKDTASTTLPGILHHEASSLQWRSLVALQNARSDDMLKVSLRAGLRGSEMASTSIPVVNFLISDESIDSDLLEGARGTADTSTITKMQIRLDVKDEYYNFRQEAAPDLMFSGPKAARAKHCPTGISLSELGGSDGVATAAATGSAAPPPACARGR